MTQSLLPMPLPPARPEVGCSASAVVLWHLAAGGTVTACEPHRNAACPMGRFIDFAILPPGRARCGYVAPEPVPLVEVHV